MNYAQKIFAAAILICGCLLIAGIAAAQWSSAILEPVVTTGDNDQLGQSSLALDDQGTLHLVFDRISGGAHQFYYTQKPLNGSWIDPIIVDNPGATYESPYLDVHKVSGVAYLVYLKAGLPRLALASECNWEYYDLQVPYLQGIFDPCLAVDANGNAHITFIVYQNNEYKIAYGYWDGTPNFHFQILTGSQLGAFGSGASPDICVRSDGSVAICYRGGGYPAYRVDVAENDALGGNNWTYQTIDVPGFECYPGAIKSTPNDDLHIGFNGNMGFGFPNDVFYATKTAGSSNWSTPIDVGGTLGGADVKLAVENDGIAHIVFMETSGNFYTGNIVYADNQGGSWTAQYLQTGDKYNPSLLMDSQGNGSLAFHQYAGYQNYDVYYYGYVAATSLPDIDITLIPESLPITIPATGGSFTYTIQLANNLPLPVSCDVWTEIVPPVGASMEVFNRAVTLEPLGTLTRDVQQLVPGRAPSGEYLYRAFVGTYPTVAVDADSFTFTKLGDGDIIGCDDGWFVTAGAVSPVPHQTDLMSVYPNPFNPATQIEFELEKPSYVNLLVVNLQGGKVADLVDGFKDVGRYKVTFDAKNRPSGIYFVKFTDGKVQRMKKITLIK